MPWSLDWFAAAKLAKEGAQIRRAGWTNKVLTNPDGGVIWMITDSAGKHIVKADEFGADEFFALDWTDQPYSANPCAAVPAYNTAPVTYGQWTDTPSFRVPPPPGFPDVGG